MCTYHILQEKYFDGTRNVHYTRKKYILVSFHKKTIEIILDFCIYINYDNIRRLNVHEHILVNIISNV